MWAFFRRKQENNWMLRKEKHISKKKILMRSFILRGFWGLRNLSRGKCTAYCFNDHFSLKVLLKVLLNLKFLSIQRTRGTRSSRASSTSSSKRLGVDDEGPGRKRLKENSIEKKDGFIRVNLSEKKRHTVKTSSEISAASNEENNKLMVDSLKSSQKEDVSQCEKFSTDEVIKKNESQSKVFFLGGISTVN